MLSWIRSARERNDYKTQWVIQRILKEAAQFSEKYNRRPVIACMGLAFKPNIDDLRESPALEVYHELLASGETVLAVEPNLMSHKNIVITQAEKAVEAADITVFLEAAHSGFETLAKKGIEIDFCGVRN